MHKFHVVPLGLALAALFAAGCGGNDGGSKADANAGADAVAASLDEWSVTVDKKTVPAGKVTFDVANKGKVPHELVVVRTDKPADALGKGRQVSEDGAVGEVEDVDPGASKDGSFDLKPGHYALICNIPGHYSSGMHADFTVS
jgi:uncharacterized cupredoxin-like copper-binding protein